MHALTRRVEFLEADRARLEALLAEALRYGAHHTGCRPLTLFEVFAETRGFNLSRAAVLDERRRSAIA
jgi:hypothetical protein